MNYPFVYESMIVSLGDIESEGIKYRYINREINRCTDRPTLLRRMQTLEHSHFSHFLKYF
jgi:hypothetical protein